jgi:hypothetical protein
MAPHTRRALVPLLRRRACCSARAEDGDREERQTPAPWWWRVAWEPLPQPPAEAMRQSTSHHHGLEDTAGWYGRCCCWVVLGDLIGISPCRQRPLFHGRELDFVALIQ